MKGSARVRAEAQVARMLEQDLVDLGSVDEDLRLHHGSGEYAVCVSVRYLGARSKRLKEPVDWD